MEEQSRGIRLGIDEAAMTATGAVPSLLYPTKYDRYGRQYLLGVSYKL